MNSRTTYQMAMRAGATQLASFKQSYAWFKAGVPVEEAISWATAGYLYEEAAPLIADGISPQMAAETTAAMLGGGSQEQQAMTWLDTHQPRYTILQTSAGDADYDRHIQPIIDAPEPAIWADAEIDMAAAGADDDKLWWAAVLDGAVIAWCAAWPVDGALWECGHNYERRGAGRQFGAYAGVFAARQAWLVERRIPCVTWIFDQPVLLHEAAGWVRTGEHDDSEHGHHWQQLTFTPE